MPHRCSLNASSCSVETVDPSFASSATSVVRPVGPAELAASHRPAAPARPRPARARGSTAPTTIAILRPRRFGRGSSTRAGRRDHGARGRGRHARRRGRGRSTGLARGLEQRGPRGAGELETARIPVVLLLRHRPGEDGVDRRREVSGSVLGDRRRRFGQVGVQDGRVVVARVRRAARQALEQHAGERVLIGPPVDALAADLFRGHVVDRAHEGPVFVRPLVSLRPLGQAEVRQVRVVAPVAADPTATSTFAGLTSRCTRPSRVGGVEGPGDLRRRSRPLARATGGPRTR